jgi:predicted RNA binding protein YcfA (HicA-like mRNA interferase family)
MPKLKVLSGEQILKILSKFGFEIISQKGSHIKLSRVQRNAEQILVIPNHKQLKKGTIKAIYNQTKKYVSEDELSKYFYNN